MNTPEKTESKNNNKNSLKLFNWKLTLGAIGSVISFLLVAVTFVLIANFFIPTGLSCLTSCIGNTPSVIISAGITAVTSYYSKKFFSQGITEYQSKLSLLKNNKEYKENTLDTADTTPNNCINNK